MRNNLRAASEAFPQTHIWMDSFHVEDHILGLENGCVGITTSPTWVSHMVLEEECQLPLMQKLVRENPGKSEQELLWMLTLENAAERSKIMLPLWEKEKPYKGRFAVQVSVYDSFNKEKIVKMAKDVHALGPNMQVKIPSTKAGIEAMEEATYLGITVMATLCFSVDQAVCAAEAIERGLKRREAEGLDNSMIAPVCAVLLGMQEDWLNGYMLNNSLVIDPAAVVHAGVAVTKKVSSIYKERGFKTRVLTAYYRHLLHFREFIGGEIMMTIPARWQKRFAHCEMEIKDYMSEPVKEEYLKALLSLEPFKLSYMEGSLDVEDFDSYAPVVMTLRYFTSSYEKAILKLRDVILPDPLA